MTNMKEVSDWKSVARNMCPVDGAVLVYSSKGYPVQCSDCKFKMGKEKYLMVGREQAKKQNIKFMSLIPTEAPKPATLFPEIDSDTEKRLQTIELMVKDIREGKR